MEKLEVKKSIERTKAIIIFTMVLLFVLIPSFIIKFSDKIEFISLMATAVAIFILHKRIRRLNDKLQLLSKNV